MGADLGLPLFEVSVSHHDLDLVLESIFATHPELAEDVNTARQLRHLQFSDGKRMATRIAALDIGLAAGGFDDPDVFDRIADRVRWLRHDLAVAPVSLAQPLLLGGSARNGPNLERIVVGPGFEWLSIRYLLGVLLGELHRLEGLSTETARKIDRVGVLDLRLIDVAPEAVARTVDAIVWADAGRNFTPAARWPPKWELTELQQFAKLQQLLAAHYRTNPS